MSHFHSIAIGLGIIYIAIDALVISGGPLPWMSRRGWGALIVTRSMLQLAGVTEAWRGHMWRCNALLFIALSILMGAIIWGIFGGDLKKRWGKLRSAALTAVNQARFQQQVREAQS